MSEAALEWLTSKAAPLPMAVEGLGQQDFLPLALHGFGDGWNAYVHGMNWYEGHLYCGTFRANNCFLKARRIGRPQWSPWPNNCPDGDVFQKLDVCAQIWRFEPGSATWEMVHRAPMIDWRGGYQVARESSYRSMTVMQGPSDRKPTLYVTPYSRTLGPVILRSEDGRMFEPVSKPGLGLDGVSSFRFLVPFKGRVFTSPVGTPKGALNRVNSTLYPMVFETRDPAGGEWRPVSEPGFGDLNNAVLFNMTVFNDYLYVGTVNHVTGCQLWKTDAEGEPPYRWTKVIDVGAYRGNFSEGVLAVCPFKGALYFGACVQDGGYDRVNRIGPASGEVIRVYPDDSWDLVMGTPRLTPQGMKTPTSGLRSGFGSPFNGYIWRMCVHDERLYVSTLNWAVILRYVDRARLPEDVRRVVADRGVQDVIEKNAGFELWSTGDGDKFSPVTTSGFGNPYNLGGRTLFSTPYGLAVGTANTFGPEVAAIRDDGWSYELNPRGGCEVWLGSHDHPPQIRDMVPQGAVGSWRVASERLRMPAIDTRGGQQEAQSIREPRHDIRFEFGRPELLRRASAGCQRKITEPVFVDAVSLHNLRVDGGENVPAEGPVLLLGNNPAVPLFQRSTFVAAHALYTLYAIEQRRDRPAWLLASHRYFEAAERFDYLGPVLEQLGYVPATEGNGARLLEMGEAVLGYPEGRASRPPYRLRPFELEYVRMAVRVGAPIVPVAFVGTHESHIIIEREFEREQILINKRRHAPADYVIGFLPAIDTRAEQMGEDDRAALSSLCGRVRNHIEEFIAQETAKRPMVEFVRHLQMSGSKTERA